MNRIFYKKKCANIALAGYILLLLYSSFHFHNISINCCPQWDNLSGNPVHGNTSDKFDSSTLSCQFNLLYGNSFTYENEDTYDSKLPLCNDSVENLPVEIFISVNAGINQLRAPPVFS